AARTLPSRWPLPATACSPGSAAAARAPSAATAPAGSAPNRAPAPPTRRSTPPPAGTWPHSCFRARPASRAWKFRRSPARRGCKPSETVLRLHDARDDAVLDGSRRAHPELTFHVPLHLLRGLARLIGDGAGDALAG